MSSLPTPRISKKARAAAILAAVALAMLFLLGRSPGLRRDAARMLPGDTLSAALRSYLMPRDTSAGASLLVVYADSGCVHCVNQLVRWERAAEELASAMADRAVVLIAPSGVEHLRELAPSLELIPLKDSDRAIRRRLGVRATPTQYFFDGAGVLRKAIVGEISGHVLLKELESQSTVTTSVGALSGGA